MNICHSVARRCTQWSLAAHADSGRRRLNVYGVSLQSGRLGFACRLLTNDDVCFPKRSGGICFLSESFIKAGWATGGVTNADRWRAALPVLLEVNGGD